MKLNDPWSKTRRGKIRRGCEIYLNLFFPDLIIFSAKFKYLPEIRVSNFDETETDRMSCGQRSSEREFERGPWIV